MAATPKIAFLSLICFQLAACDFATEFFNRPPFVPPPSGGFAINIRENGNGDFSPHFFDEPVVSPISQAFAINIKEDSHGAQLPVVPIHQSFDVPAIPILPESLFPVDILSQGIPFEDFHRREFELARLELLPPVIADPSLLFADFDLHEKPVKSNSHAYSIDIQEPIQNVLLKSLVPSHAYVISTRSESSPRLKAD